MKNGLALLCVAAVSAAPVLADAPVRQQQERPAFRAATDVVRIDVSVTQKNAPVTGLSAQDFELLDNGHVQDVTLEAIEAVPVDVTLVIDQTNFSRVVIGGRLGSGLDRIASYLRPIDRLRVITFATDVHEVVSMRAPRREDGSQGLDASLLGRPTEQGLDGRHDPGLRRWSLFDAVLFALAQPPELGRRHLVVVLSTVAETGSVAADGALLQAVASRTDALLHAALYSQRIGGEQVEGLGQRYARWAVTGAAAATGGKVYDFDDGVGAFRKIFDDFRRSYVLSYTLKGVPRRGWHSIAVKVPRFPVYDVRARAGYLGR